MTSMTSIHCHIRCLTACTTRCKNTSLSFALPLHSLRADGTNSMQREIFSTPHRKTLGFERPVNVATKDELRKL